MANTNKQTKDDLINSLRNRGIYFKPVNNIEYRTRCPFCGDSDNENTGHLYIRINPSDNLPIVYHCFKCESKGIMKEETLLALDIHDVGLKSGLMTLNHTSDRMDNKNLMNETKSISFDYQLPEIKRGPKIAYIEDRLGVHLSDDDLIKMKVITSLREFLILNDIKTLTCPNEDAYRFEDHFVGFLTYGNSHILLRDISNNDRYRWVKYPITEDSRANRIFYVMSMEIDPMTTEDITINLAEGVFDTLSICHNLGYNEKNVINICVSGKYYDKILLFLLDLGLVGSNITINVFSDNDAIFNKKSVKGTSLEHYQKVLKNFKYLYGEINVFYNLINKDCGVPKEKICLKKFKL